MKEKIWAVVVTYNRKELLKECIDALLSQTVELDKILIVDNASTDGTEKLVEDYSSEKRMVYLKLSINKGGAGGFKAGIEKAISEGADWIWIMDDDAEPKKNSLEKLLECKVEDAVAITPMEEENGKLFHYHRGFFSSSIFSRGILKRLKEADIKGRCIEIDHSSFVGLLIKSDAVREIGLPQEDFFIKFDDLEYCLRLKKCGKIYMSTNSLIIHKAELKKKKGTWPFLVDHYYARRNLLIVLKQYSKAKFYMYSLYFLLRSFLELPFILISGEDVGVKLRANLKAIFHGITGKIGRTF